MESTSLMDLYAVNEPSDHLSMLPAELKDVILDHLSVLGIIALSQTSKHYECLIDAWSPAFFDECACMPLELMHHGPHSQEDSADIGTQPRTARDLAVTDTGWPVPLAQEDGETAVGGGGATDVVNQISSMFSNLDAAAEHLIMTAPPDSFTDENIQLAMELGYSGQISLELANRFSSLQYERTWRKTFPYNFPALSKAEQGRHRCTKLLDVLKCERDMTYEIIPTRLSARAFLIHMMHLRCSSCTSKDTVESFFHHRYCRRCVTRLEKEQRWSPLICIQGVKHCFGNNVDARILGSINPGGVQLRTLKTYEAALKQDQGSKVSFTQDIAHCAALAKLKDLFRSCYVNATAVEGLFDLLMSHYTCQAVLEDACASSKLDVATDYLLSACARYSRIRDKYMRNHARMERDLLQCSAICVFVKYGPMTIPDHLQGYKQVRPSPHEDSAVSAAMFNMYRFSFWFAWACLTIQKRDPGESPSVKASESYIRETALGNRRTQGHARHDVRQALAPRE